MDRHKKQRRRGPSGPVLAANGSPPSTPKRVPRTPNNTPVSTPVANAINRTPVSARATSATNPANEETTEPDMAKQNSERAAKRHLVRWNDPMDKKLLLAIQFACNSTGVAVPWDRVSAIMGSEISSGAVIQHLAKVRVRLIELGFPVPPPLRRGGGSARTAIAASSPKKAGVTKKKAPKAKSTRKKVEHNSDESDDGEDEWKGNDSDLDFGQPRAKRTKSSAKSPNGRSIKKEDSDNGDASGNEDASDDTNEELVATGAGFLALEDDHGSRPKTSKKTPSQNKKSLIVSLPIQMGSIKEEEDDDDMSDNEGEAEATGGGLARGQSLSSSPYNQNLADLAAAQMEPAPGPINTSSYVGTYNNLHRTSPQVNAFNGGLYRNKQSLLQQPDDDIDFDYLSSGKGANIDFNSAEYMKEVGIYDFETTGNRTYNGSTQQSDFGYQPANGYHATPAVFGDAHHGLPLSHWSNENGFAGSSMASTANQTPAENSAGADFGGYFANAQFHADTFDGEAYDPSAGHGMASLNSGYVSDAFNNDAFNTEFYGNSSDFA